MKAKEPLFDYVDKDIDYRIINGDSKRELKKFDLTLKT